MGKRHVATLGWILVLLLWLATAPGATLLQPVQAQDPWVYEEDFEDRRAQDWELEQPGDGVGWDIWQEEDGNLALYGLGHVFATYRGGEWEDYVLRFRVKLVEQVPVHLNFRSSNQGRYVIAFRTQGVYLFKEAPWGTFYHDLAASEFDHEPGRWYAVDIRGEGASVEVFVDGRMEVRHDDPSPLTRGSFSFETLENGAARIDDVRVEVLGPPPSPDLAILAVDQWEVSRDGRVLGLYVEIINRGTADSPRTQVWAGEQSRGWESALVNVPPLAPGEVTIVPVELEIDDRQRGRAHTFDVGVDPENRLPDDSDRENNWAQTPRIEIQPRAPSITFTPTRTRTPTPRPAVTSTPTRTRTPTATPRPARITPTPPPRPPAPTRIPEWAWIGTTLLLSGASFVVGRNLGGKTKLLWTDKGHIQWHVEAQNKLPEAKTPCKWACQVNVSADLLDRWQLQALELSSAMRLRGGKTPPPKRVEGDALKPLDSLANIAGVWHRPETVRKRLAPVVDALLQEVLSWEEEGQTPPSIRLDATLKAPINAQFKLYHCQQSLKGLQWVEWLKWKTKLNQPAGEFVGILRGPTAGEADFGARARQELEDCLMELVSVVRFKL